MMEAIGKVNRLISQWPTDDNLPADGFDSVKSMYKKLNAGLGEIGGASDSELKFVTTFPCSCGHFSS
jgi:SAGA-associated factor 29